MKNNSKKRRGFTLMEVVISLAIISIISVSAYNGLIMIIKQTKAGQVKQEAALEGKKIVEMMKADSFEVPNEDGSTLNIGNNIRFQKEADESGNIFYVRYLNEEYSVCEKAVSKYTEKITVSLAKSYKSSQTTGSSIELDTSDESSSTHSKLYISKINSKDYISYWKYKANETYVPNTTNSEEIPINKQSLIEMYFYFTKDNTGDQEIEIKDYAGNDIFQDPIIKTDSNDKDIIINFSNYINADGSLPTNKNIELNIFNKTADIPKIYIEKYQKLNVDVKARKGEINVYDNRAENPEEDNIGTLYDIKVEINDSDGNLFTGYSKKNIH